MPEVRMVAEHIAIEYGTVHFQDGTVSLWLPRSVELYFDWKGMRVHRRLSYENYLLFSVDEKERIDSPKGTKAPPDLDSVIRPTICLASVAASLCRTPDSIAPILRMKHLGSPAPTTAEN